MTELALVLLPFLMIVFAIVEVGRAWAAKQAVTNAAREGARVLVSPYGAGYSFSSVDDARAAALTTAREYLAIAGLSTDASIAEISFVRQTVDGAGNVTTTPLGGDITRGEHAGLQIRYKFETAVPALLLSASSPLNLSATSVMQHE
jgi:Flp pilus assembly protein TadG